MAIHGDRRQSKCSFLFLFLFLFLFFYTPSMDVVGPSDSPDKNPARFCIIERPETVQDFAKMELQEIQDNIRSRRNKILLHMEERMHAGVGLLTPTLRQSFSISYRVMEDKVEKEMDLLTLQSQLSQANAMWKQGLEHHQSQVETLQEKLKEVKASIQGSEHNAQKELELLWRRVKTTATLLTYLKSKARMMAVPHLAHTSCGIKHQEGIGFIDKNGKSLSDWSKNADLSSFESPDEEALMVTSNRLGSLDANDGAYIGEIFKSVQMVTDVMESLVKRVIMSENETASERDKVNLSQEEIKRKTLQIESMSAKVEEMERFALVTNCILNEMRQKVEDMVLETSRQRQRAAENEQELSRVKQDFESLRSFVSSLISVRETLLSSEMQFQTMERLFERLVAKANHLVGEKVQKEAEVQKLMAENVRLSALLDKKEAQLLAMNEQCKFMALK